jgi:[ribosomal protein S5]-alanine N-acetyltransferase
MIVAETERLSIRRFDTEDAPFILALLNTPGWLQFIGDKHIKTLNDAENYIISGPVKSYKKFGFGLYLVSLKHNNTPIGMCGLIQRAELKDIDIGFAFLPEHGGKGYALESVEAMMVHAKNLKITRLVAITLPENKPCLRLLEKAGMRFEKTVKFPAEDEVLMLLAKNL